MVQGCEALTEKEKQTLRLLLVGHDAKSIARHLGLSVHTINERLRDARRKLSVSSSKEAARLLRQSEAVPPELVGDMSFGDAVAAAISQPTDHPSEVPRKERAGWVIGGLAMLSMFAALVAMLTHVEGAQTSAQTREAVSAETAVTSAAREWLALVDAGKWSESWAATGKSFRSLNTVETWRSASENARVPLGRVLSRALVSEADVPAPPNGYRVVRFRTDFDNKRDAIETLSLDREGDGWRVVGIYIS